jgi:hypothetical protein
MSYNLFKRNKSIYNKIAFNHDNYIIENPYDIDKLVEHFRKYPDKLQDIIVKLRKEKIEKIRNK